jgi:hypothetical protein
VLKKHIDLFPIHIPVPLLHLFLYEDIFYKVVILGVQRLSGGWVGGWAVLSITSNTNWTYWTYSLNILKNTLNILEYARIYSNISLLGKHEGLSGQTGRRSKQADGHPNNLDFLLHALKFAFAKTYMNFGIY